MAAENRAVRSFALALSGTATSIAALAAAAGIGMRPTYREVTIQVSVYTAAGTVPAAVGAWLGDETLNTTISGVLQRGVELAAGQSKLYRSGGPSNVFLANIFAMNDPNTAGNAIILIDAFSG